MEEGWKLEELLRRGQPPLLALLLRPRPKAGSVGCGHRLRSLMQRRRNRLTCRRKTIGRMVAHKFPAQATEGSETNYPRRRRICLDGKSLVLHKRLQPPQS